MKIQPIIALLFFGTAFWIGIPVQHAHAYDTQKYEKINSSLSCQCGCGLLVSVCTMDGCMCEGVRKQVGQMLDQGKSEKEITQAMISIYGEQILAAPPKSGFNLSAYVLPFFFLIVGGVVLYSVVKRWVPAIGPSGESGADERSSEPRKGDSELKHRDQIEDELKNLDF
ncbi:MAG: Cytochrome c-type biogenesis protein CcmH [Candidatus Marinimicrobia bacterium]|nr:Cytochrome c-type biogenesis protein CcmH [Candidatus Neomarinimicrobiota bacterium]